MALHMNLAPTPEPTISDIERTVQNGLEELRGAPLNDKIAAALKFLTPPGYRPIAQLEEDGRKKRSTAAASNWNPETGEIVIYFERTDEAKTRPQSSIHAPENAGQHPVSGVTRGEFLSPARMEAISNGDAKPLLLPEVTSLQIQQCCEALANAEKAGKSFIALKWFRDNGLIEAGFAWCDTLSTRQAVLTKAIDAGAITTSSIPNPKAPLHPTTTIKVNRESEYARSIAPRFQPIRLRGAGLSASETLIRDRERF